MIENVLKKYGDEVEYNVCMAKHTSFRAGGNAKALFKPKNIDELKQFIDELNKNNIKFTVIGNGSNLIFKDGLYDGVVIKICKDFLGNQIIKDGNKYTVSAGTLLVKFAKLVCKDGFAGMEFATGIPGTVGGGIYMNAGCYGGEISDYITNIKALDKQTFEVIDFDKNDCEFSYRNSFFQNDKYIIISADFEFETGNQEEIDEKVEKYKVQRVTKQPLNYPNAGSTFKRPKDDFAGRLIEVCGLKGYRVGDAEVSEKHAGFIVNVGNATATDIEKLINEVKSIVLKNTNVELELEMKII